MYRIGYAIPGKHMIARMKNRILKLALRLSGCNAFTLDRPRTKAVCRVHHTRHMDG